jgi:hypothetical protein
MKPKKTSMKTNLQKTFAALLLCAFALNLRAQVNTAVMVDASGTLIAPITGGTASLDALTVNRAGTLSIDGSTLTGTASSNDLRIHNVILSTPLVGGGTMINSLMSGGVVSGAQVNNSTINNSNITGAFTGTVNNAIISGGTASLDTLTVSNSLTVSATQLVLPGPQDYTSDTITFNSYQNNYGMAHKLNNWLMSNSGVGVTGGWALGNGGLWSPPDYYNEIVNPVIRLGADTDGFFGSVTFETGTQGLTINSHQYSQPNRLTVNSSTVSFNGIVSGTFTGDGSGLTNLPPVPAATGTTLGGVIVGKNLMVSNGTLGLDHVLLDDGGMASLIPFNRMLVDGGEAPAVNWGSRELKAPSNITAFNWNTGTFGIPVYGYFTGSFSGNGAGLTVNAANVEGTFNTLLASTGSISSFDASNAYVSYLYVNQNISANDIGFNMISGSSINLTQNGNLTAGDGSQLFKLQLRRGIHQSRAHHRRQRRFQRFFQRQRQSHRLVFRHSQPCRYIRRRWEWSNQPSAGDRLHGGGCHPRRGADRQQWLSRCIGTKIR